MLRGGEIAGTVEARMSTMQRSCAARAGRGALECVAPSEQWETRAGALLDHGLYVLLAALILLFGVISRLRS